MTKDDQHVPREISQDGMPVNVVHLSYCLPRWTFLGFVCFTRRKRATCPFIRPDLHGAAAPRDGGRKHQSTVRQSRYLNISCFLPDAFLAYCIRSLRNGLLYVSQLSREYAFIYPRRPLLYTLIAHAPMLLKQTAPVQAGETSPCLCDALRAAIHLHVNKSL
eukprot:20355-Pyramimonas_sp.AAC.1